MERWFTERRKSKVLDLAYREMTLAIDTVTELEKAIKAASTGDKEEAKKSIDRLFLLEEEIDSLRRSVFEELTRGSLPSNDREDIMHLVKRLDVMADHVKDSARNVLVLFEANIPQEIWNAYVDMAKDLVSAASTLQRGIEKLGTDPLEARRLSEEVDKIEGEVDKKYLKMKETLLRHGKDTDSATLLMLKDLLESMEHTADTCDDTADYIRILTISRGKD
jgi:predicted phosphate transport protein (TIGR00153 family)